MCLKLHDFKIVLYNNYISIFKKKTGLGLFHSAALEEGALFLRNLSLRKGLISTLSRTMSLKAVLCIFGGHLFSPPFYCKFRCVQKYAQAPLSLPS